MILVLLLIGAICMGGAGAVTVDTVEVRGSVVNIDGAQTTDLVWNAHNFGAFWYDLNDNLMTEVLTISANALSAPGDLTVDKDMLLYTTTPVYMQYELYKKEGLVV